MRAITFDVFHVSFTFDSLQSFIKHTRSTRVHVFLFRDLSRSRAISCFLFPPPCITHREPHFDLFDSDQLAAWHLPSPSSLTWLRLSPRSSIGYLELPTFHLDTSRLFSYVTAGKARFCHWGCEWKYWWIRIQLPSPLLFSPPPSLCTSRALRGKKYFCLYAFRSTESSWKFFFPDIDCHAHLIVHRYKFTFKAKRHLIIYRSKTRVTRRSETWD